MGAEGAPQGTAVSSRQRTDLVGQTPSPTQTLDRALQMPMDPGCVFCANFQLVFGKDSNKGRESGRAKPGLGVH